MKYNLTSRQKAVASAIVGLIREGKLGESFLAVEFGDLGLSLGTKNKQTARFQGDFILLEALRDAELLVVHRKNESMECTATGKLYTAVESNFAEDAEAPVVRAVMDGHPPEITISLQRLRAKYPDPSKLGFLIMRFIGKEPLTTITKVVRDVGVSHGLTIVRADDHEFHEDLWRNVQTYLHGCAFGISIHERLFTEDHNPNIGLEVGYMMAMKKPVLLLKDENMEALQTDLAGRLYKSFNPHDAAKSVPELMKRWFTDYGIAFTGAGH